MAYGNITLTSGMRQNLVSLQKTNSLMEITQTRLASGKKVNTALDDPVKYFAALGHTNRATDLAARKSEMGEGIQTIKAANNGIEAIVSLIDSAKSLANSANAIDASVAGSQNATDRAALSAQFTEVLTQIDTLAADSGYKGINLLADGTLTVEYDENGDSSSTIAGFDGSATVGLGIEAQANAWIAADDVTAAIEDLDTAKATLRSKSQTMSSSLSTITTRQDFTKNMINTLEDGASNLVNADMNEEGANMLMLQTRQALGTTSLSLASQAAQNVLRLF